MPPFVVCFSDTQTGASGEARFHYKMRVFLFSDAFRIHPRCFSDTHTLLFGYTHFSLVVINLVTNYLAFRIHTLCFSDTHVCLLFPQQGCMLAWELGLLKGNNAVRTADVVFSEQPRAHVTDGLTSESTFGTFQISRIL